MDRWIDRQKDKKIDRIIEEQIDDYRQISLSLIDNNLVEKCMCNVHCTSRCRHTITYQRNKPQDRFVDIYYNIDR